MFGAFENHLNAIAFCFLCHNSAVLLERKDCDVFKVEIAFSLSLLESGVESDLVDGAERTGRESKLNPHILLYPVEFLCLQVYLELALGATL